MKQKSSSTRVPKKHFATAALMLNLGVASVYAQQVPVTLSFSGTAVPSTINIQPGAVTSEYNFAGNSAIGPFTFRIVNASSQPPGTCPAANHPYFGAGVLRFQDGSLLMVNLTQGSDCIEITSTGPVAHCARTFQITGGTGRLKNATGGTIVLTGTILPVLFDAANDPVFFAVTGELTGAVSGLAMAAESQDVRQ